MGIFSALLFGLVFGLGILVSGMGNPAKVLNFFDFAGTWDPSLALVMGGALAVTAVGYRVVFGWPRPLLASGFNLPAATRIAPSLVLGSAVFGIGWGLSGFCPGGLLPVLGTGGVKPLIFFAGLLVGIVATRLFVARSLEGRGFAARS
jgi:uncharacterized protein